MNARKELEPWIKEHGIICGYVHFDEFLFDDTPSEYITLKVNHTPIDLENFLKAIDIEYDNGFGGQTLFGVIWLTNEIWLTRGEYDGSEWWEGYKYPQLPDNLK